MKNKQMKIAITSNNTQNVQLHKFGHWIFLLGVVVAVVAGIPNINIPGEVYILVLSGAVVGLLNITAKEVHDFLTASIVLILVSAAWGATGVGGKESILIVRNIVIFVSPAAFIVALKTVWNLAQSA